MDNSEILNIVFSCLSTFLVLILLLLYPARKLAGRKRSGGSGIGFAVHRILRRTHAAIGILAIPVIFFHCRLAAEASGEKSFLGGLLLILTILLALSYVFRKQLGRHWLRLHRILAAAFPLFTLCHIVISMIT